MATEFPAERARFDLRFTCEDCAFHDAATDTCAHDWPDGRADGVHRRRVWTGAELPDTLVFCKEFELQ